MTAADKRWAREVKDREGWRCQRCLAQHIEGSRGMNAHHVFTRSRKSTRLLLENGIAVCTGCHRWVHANPYEAEVWLRSVVEDFDDLRLRSNHTKASRA